MRDIMAKANRLSDLEETTNESSAQPVIPPGTKAKVRVDYETTVDPNLTSQAQRFNNELYELADTAINERMLDDTARPAALPFDPVSDFCALWRNYAGCLMKVTRLPDPATRRMPGQQYARPCFEIESLGATPFDPANLEGTLQIVNGNSGGVFRLWLVDDNGMPIEDAHLDRVVIGDPPKQFNRRENERELFRDPRYAVNTPQQQAPAPPPQKSEMELRMERIQGELFETVLKRALNPVAPTAPDPTANMSEDDRLTLLLVKQGALLPSIVQKITTLAGAPEAATIKETWQERGINALLQIAQTNPAIIERVSGVVERIVERVLPNPRAPVNIAPNLQQSRPVQHAPAQRANPTLAAPPVTQYTENPDAPEDERPDVDEDEDIMDIISSLFTLVNDTRPFTTTDPVFRELSQAYPQKFRGALIMIATQPLDSIIAWLSTQDPLYESLLTSPITAGHYRARLAELQAFCKAQSAPAQPATPSAPATPAPVVNLDQLDDETNEVLSQIEDSDESAT